MRPDAVLALIAVLTIPAIIVWALNLRHKRHEMLHQERMAALEKGAAPPVLVDLAHAAGSPRIYFLRGLIWLFGGLGLTIFIFTFASVVPPGRQSSFRDLETKLWAAQRLRNLGASEESIKELMAQKPTERTEPDPRGLAALGLIPIGVGAAYLVFYSSEEKRLKALAPAPPGGDAS